MRLCAFSLCRSKKSEHASFFQVQAVGLHQQPVAKGRRRLLLVGPEGDFTPAELEVLLSAGAKPVGLGNNRLRVETAAIALLSAATLWDCSGAKQNT